MAPANVFPIAQSRRPKNEHAYDTLLLDIICGTLRAGEVVDEASLANRYGLPRAGIREALTRLSFEGLVERRPRLGSVISDLGAIELEQLFALRVQLEGSAAGLAATNATNAEIAAINEAFVGVDTAIAAGDHRALISMDLAFHRAVGKATHNRWLARVTNTLMLGSLRFWHYSLRRRSEETLRTEIAAHLRVAQAIQQRDPDAAQLAIREILAEFPSTVKDVFDGSLNSSITISIGIRR